MNTKATKSKLLVTIGVSRAFGDHQLTVPGLSQVKIKPFLSCEPHVSFLDLAALAEGKEKEIETKKTVGKIDKRDFLLMSCDGPFDVLSNEDVRASVTQWIDNNVSADDIFAVQKWNDCCKMVCDMAYQKGTIDDLTQIDEAHFPFKEEKEIGSVTIVSSFKQKGNKFHGQYLVNVKKKSRIKTFFVKQN
ncbi:protein phosphatase 1H [Reticulomyxa filosa]|uniref:Protein phosphatase 1H n=1 Tax=Reticulomyxa filosa TaxID=46433 RepID=X6LXX2_RETFI|nr:protein phosphatase 1H [Reticulomyxa filosa]|eukprot:ETO05580.1 protein phosphatase 1H [Reticulomyxa filosa]